MGGAGWWGCVREWGGSGLRGVRSGGASCGHCPGFGQIGSAARLRSDPRSKSHPAHQRRAQLPDPRVVGRAAQRAPPLGYKVSAAVVARPLPTTRELLSLAQLTIRPLRPLRLLECVRCRTPAFGVPSRRPPALAAENQPEGERGALESGERGIGVSRPRGVRRRVLSVRRRGERAGEGRGRKAFGGGFVKIGVGAADDGWEGGERRGRLGKRSVCV